MNKCPMCKKGSLRAAGVLHTLALGDGSERQEFSEELRGVRCDQCGEGFVADRALEKFEASVVARLGTTGFRSGGAVRFVRKAAGLKAADVAELFGVSLQTVSAWENGKHPADNATRATLAALALEATKGETTTRDRLVAMHVGSDAPSKHGKKATGKRLTVQDGYVVVQRDSIATPRSKKVAIATASTSRSKQVALTTARRPATTKREIEIA